MSLLPPYLGDLHSDAYYFLIGKEESWSPSLFFRVAKKIIIYAKVVYCKGFKKIQMVIIILAISLGRFGGGGIP